MKIKIILGLVMLLCMSVASAITYEGVTFTAGTNNASINFSTAVNATNITIGSEYVALHNATFPYSFNYNYTGVTNTISLINWSTNGTQIKSEDFFEKIKFWDATNSIYVSGFTFGEYNGTLSQMRIFYGNLTNGTQYNLNFVKDEYTTSSHTFTFEYDDSTDATFTVSFLGALLQEINTQTANVTGWVILLVLTMIATIGLTTVVIKYANVVNEFNRIDERIGIIIVILALTILIGGTNLLIEVFNTPVSP